MEKTIKINISGIIFQIEEDAYEILKNYLHQISAKLKGMQGGNEMIEDIEARIAEIFQSSPSWKTGIISAEDVNEMMATMGSPEEIAGDMEGEPVYREKGSRRLYRDSDGAIIGGVCNGIGAYTGIDPVWIRVLFVVFTLLYLSGLFVYAILWIVLPRAITPSQKRELHGQPGRRSETGFAGEMNMAADNLRESTSRGATRVGHAFNEVFRAFGKFFIILFRVILAIIGVAFIITGFSLLFSFLIIAFFNSPVIMGNFFETDIFYLPDFLSFIVNPALTPWLMILSSLVIILPLLAIIYWGIRMVFQFRVRDLILNLSMFVIWIVSCSALLILLFSEGISFSNSGRVSSDLQYDPENVLYIEASSASVPESYDRSITIPFDDEVLYLNENERIIYASPQVSVYNSDEPKIEIVKYSNGKTYNDAMVKAEKLEYSCMLDGDTLKLDRYFSIPKGNVWSGARIKIRLYLPEGTTIYVDDSAESMFRDYLGNGVYSYQLGDNSWEMTADGLEKK